MTSPTDGGREEFLGAVRRALGRTSGGTPEVPRETALSDGEEAVRARAEAATRRSRDDSEALLAELEQSAAAAGWVVAKAHTDEEAARYIEALARRLEARSVVASAHAAVERLGLTAALAPSGVRVLVMAAGEESAGPDRDERRRSLREAAIEADIGVTGVDYAIAETGSCVVMARTGVSRLVSLLPPVHVALVERTQVLPSLDELFTLQRHDFLEGADLGYMNIISGPSRSADIEQTIVVGVHGPGETHMVLLG